MAEGEGFEPSESDKRFTPLAGEPVQPLWHPSFFLIFVIIFWTKWRRDRDSNPRSTKALNGFQDRRLRPLSHLSEFNLKLILELNFILKNSFIYILKIECSLIFKLFIYGSPDWIRTSDQMINSHLLYRWATEEHLIKLVDFIFF